MLPVIINTRPLERATPLTDHLQALGFAVVDIPMLALQPREITDADRLTMRAWLAGDYQALVIVSPTAAASGLAVWQALEQSTVLNRENFLAADSTAMASRHIPSHIIAVGSATARVLETAKLQAASYQVLQPLVANNEGMLAMPEVESLQAGDKLLVWRGLGGRRLLVDTLQARGVHIDSIAWYERTMPALAQEQYQHWQQQFIACNSAAIKPIVIISSGTAFEHWQQVIESTQALNTNEQANTALRLSDFSYVVLGERLANIVANQQLNYWQVEDLAPETISAVIQSSIKDTK